MSPLLADHVCANILELFPEDDQSIEDKMGKRKQRKRRLVG
jgi:hypothetical protein